jgi:hypothetical protein
LPNPGLALASLRIAEEATAAINRISRTVLANPA